MKKQKTWTVVLLVIIGIATAILSNGFLALMFTSFYALWVVGMAIFWSAEGKLEIINKVKE